MGQAWGAVSQALGLGLEAKDLSVAQMSLRAVAVFRRKGEEPDTGRVKEARLERGGDISLRMRKD